MVDIGELLGGDRNKTEEQMYKVIEFEIQLANVSSTYQIIILTLSVANMLWLFHIRQPHLLK